MSGAITEATPRPIARSRDRVLSVLGLAVLVAASVGLFIVSRGKWSDAIIDSGREWIVPDALARGDLLYRDVVYWFGPFTPYFHAAFFKVFGSSFRTLVVAGVVGSIGVIFALYFALRGVTGKLEAALWTALAVPVLIFMPNAGGPILGMGYRIWHAAAFAFVAIALSTRPFSRPLVRDALVGVLCGLAGLCRTEWGVVVAASVCLTVLLREGSGAPRLRRIGASLTALVVVFGGTIAIFVTAAGSKAVFEDGHVLLYGLPQETREFLIAYSGLRDWRLGVLELLYSTAMWAGLLWLIHILAIGSGGRSRVLRKAPILAILLLVLVVFAALGGAGGAVLFSAAPLICAGAAVVGLRSPSASRVALVGFGVAGAFFFYRRPFHIGDGAYVGPPLLFAFVCAAGIVQAMLDGERDPTVRDRLRSYAAVTVIALTVLAFLGRGVRYGEDERVPIPGTEGSLSARPEVVAGFEALARSVRSESRPGDGLVVFPEGEILNYLTGLPNPIRHKLYIPGYLTDDNETEVLRELEDHPPNAIVLLFRPTGEYGRPTFGGSYGRRIRNWIDANYAMRQLNVNPRWHSRVTSSWFGTRRK